MCKKVVFEWSYTPKNFLEADHKLDFNGIEIHLSNGQISVIIEEKTLINAPHFVTDVEQAIMNFLNGVSIQSHSSFEISRKPTKYYNEDGSINKQVAIGGSTSYVMVGGQVDFKVLDKHGNVKRDSKKERIEVKKLWGLLTSNVDGDNQKLINSYLNAIEDKKNELIHLYEIRDFVAKKLGGAKKAREILSVPKKDWDLLGDIANNRPIFEGRHRGKHAEQLRKATREELNSARKITKKILWNYLKHCNEND